MNGATKARDLQTKFEIQGWVFSINYRRGAYSIKCGKSRNSTIFDRIETVYMHGNGKIAYTMGHSDDSVWEQHWNINGVFSETIESHLLYVLSAYAQARVGSSAAKRYLLADSRLAPNN